ncbi:glycosyltransferase family 39 protein [Engelhardtia mirabilis]|uniref:Dolichyl-phosphate-mannose-protein mannosyltransferase n=1 Tax=Engelhardtia mirabilis TaxID=2528011 RepID=A0A518BQC8_9BACT|nr:Dolichyl-phosphate-mannose-protein mannosyltransferase [Planctomycetes bacterium Pla133]QDV03506.1 Dolichyl-phosphate-mannose-protein mannosyltransferase [Planctomycetes bacterium Pla86]
MSRTTLYWLAVLALLGVYGGSLLALAYQLPPTADERLYFSCGYHLVTYLDWSVYHLRYQGPLGLYLNQLFAGDLDPAVYTSQELMPALALGRLGIAFVALLTAALTFAAAFAVIGRGGALLALALFVLNPMLLGHGALVTTDMPHALATLLATAALLWCVQRPSAQRALVVGFACGLAVGTKYLAAVFVPLIAIVAITAVVARGDGQREASAGRRLKVGSAALGAMVVGGLFALHAAYLFTQPFAPAAGDAYRSAAFAALDAPLLRQLPRVLPLALAQGLDFMLSTDGVAGPRAGYMLGAYHESTPLYYPLALAVKTPVVVLGAFALGAVALLLPSRRITSRQRVALGLLLALIVLPIAALTFGTSYKLGVRYLLQLMPLMAIVGGFAVVTLAAAPSAVRRALAAGLVLAVVPVGLELRGIWPNAIAYYNAPAGGSDAGLEYFADSNTEWGQMKDLGLVRLEDEFGALQVVTRAGGPRFGRLAIYFDQLAPQSRQAAGPSDHWLLGFEPIGRTQGAWRAYDVRPDDYERLAATDPSGGRRRELVIAYLAEGRLEEAARHQSLLSPSDSLSVLASTITRWVRGQRSEVRGRARRSSTSPSVGSRSAASTRCPTCSPARGRLRPTSV